MEFEAKGAEDMLSLIRLHLQNELEKRDFRKGPKLLSMDSGVFVDFLKGDFVVGIQILPGEEGETTLRMESEQEIAELNDVWDAALISFGQDVLARLKSFAIDKNKVAKGFQS